jgi:RND family efflux transporter MFP subunit
MKPLLLGLLATAAIGVGAALHIRAQSSAPPVAAGDEDAVRVVRRTVGSVVKATGVIKPRVGAEVRVGSRLSGIVTRLFVQVGDSVAKGQRLAELDDRDLVARRNEADANVQRALAESRYAEADLRRKRTLATAQVISPDDLDFAERACAVAAQQVAVARAAAAYAETQLAYTRIEAPISGVVASVATQEGETVSAGFAAPTFVTLIDLSRLEVWAYVDETDIGRIAPGQRARFTVDTYADHTFEGVVTAIYPKAEIRDNVVNYVTVVRFDPPVGCVLRPEMTATVRVGVSLRENVPALPLRALTWEGDQAHVQFRGPGDRVERRAVAVGTRDAEWAEIVSGVREGDVVLTGNLKGDNQP